MTELARTLADLGRDVRAKCGLIETEAANMVRHAIDVGLTLTDVKQRTEHGGWLPWLQEWFPHSERTAQKWMHLAANTNRGSHLQEAGSIRAALHLLATPDDKPREPRPDPETPEGVMLAQLNPSNIIDTDAVDLDYEPPAALAQPDHTRWRRAQERLRVMSSSLAEASQQHLAPDSVASLLEDQAREARFLSQDLQHLANAFRRQAA